MNKTIKIIITIIGILIAIHIITAIAGICPPSGPWPMPPWCEKYIEHEALEMAKGDFGIIKGHTVMDAGGYITTAIKDGSIRSTMKAMKQDGGDWFAYDYYWAYDDTAAPSIVDEKEYFPEYHMKDSDFKELARHAHAENLHVMLITELEWVIPSEIKNSYTDWDEFMEYQNKVWNDGQNLVREKSRQLKKDPSGDEINYWWDTWFIEFGEFMMYSARKAQENGYEMLVIGKQIDGAMIKENDLRWRSLIADVRSVYSGKIAQAPLHSENSVLHEEITWTDELDYLIIYYYNSFSKEADPAEEDLVSTMKKFNREQFDPLYEKYGVDIIFLTPFQSRDHAASQEWFEPMASAPHVDLDLEAQDELYRAFFKSTANEEWFAGLMTWGYWTEQDTGLPTAFEKSSTVRGKPAAKTIREWFGKI